MPKKNEEGPWFVVMVCGVVWFYRLNIIPTLVSTSTLTLTRVWQYLVVACFMAIYSSVTELNFGQLIESILNTLKVGLAN